MHAADDRPEFAPPPQPGLLRAFGLAVLAHMLLVAALTHGLRWQREAQVVAVEAELWSALPREAAPKEEPAPPPPPPKPVVQAPPQPEPPVKSEADIALERERQQRLEQERREAEREKQRALAEAKKKREEELARRKREEELARRKAEEQKKIAEAKRKEEERKRREEQEAREAKLREQIRKETLERTLAMAGKGAPTSTGNAAQSSGPSKEWAGRVIARVRPNIVFSGERSSAWVADVEVRLAPDGTIVSRRIVKSTAPARWNEAVLRALDKTEVLPRQADGTVPSHGTISFRPD
jgi:colicin import membrane protein